MTYPTMTRINFNQISGATVNVLDFIPKSQHAAIIDRTGTGTYDCHDAIMLAIAALPHPSATLYFPNGVYWTSSIVMTNNATANSASACTFKGDGSGGYYMTTIHLLTSSGTLFDFTQNSIVNSYVSFSDLLLYGNGQSATGGIGIKLSANSTWSRFTNVTMSLFATAIYLPANTYIFYSTFEGCQFNYNYDYGVYALVGTLFNGVQFNSCHFSNTGTFTGDVPNHVGVGFSAYGGTAGACFSNCTFENNSGYGCYLQGFYSWTMESCYFELNGDSDIFLNNETNGATPQFSLSNSYFDEDTNRAHDYRVYVLGGCRVTLINNKFMALGGGSADEPIFYYPITGQGPNEKGLYTGIAINNEYVSKYLTNQTYDAGWFIVDSKHPMVQFNPESPATPTGRQTVKAGGLTLNTDEATIATNTLGWLTEVSGRTTTLPTNVATVTTIYGTSAIYLNDTNNTVYPGDVIKVAGTQFQDNDTAVITDETTVLATNGATSYLTSGAATVAVSGATLTYKLGTVTALAKIPLATGNLPQLGAGHCFDTVSVTVKKKDAAVAGAQVIAISAQISSKNTGNHAIVRGYDDATGAKIFVDVVTWITNGGAPTVSGTNETGTPAARTYAVSTISLTCAMAASAAYTVTAVNTMLGY